MSLAWKSSWPTHKLKQLSESQCLKCSESQCLKGKLKQLSESQCPKCKLKQLDESQCLKYKLKQLGESQCLKYKLLNEGECLQNKEIQTEEMAGAQALFTSTFAQVRTE